MNTLCQEQNYGNSTGNNNNKPYLENKRFLYSLSGQEICEGFVVLQKICIVTMANNL